MNSLLFNPFTLKMIFLHTFYYSKDNSIAQSYLNYNQLVRKCHQCILLVYFSCYLPACFIFIHSIIDSWILEMQKTVKIQNQVSLVFSIQFNQRHNVNHFDHNLITTEVTSSVVRTLLDKLWILLKQQKDKIDKLIDKIDSLKKTSR